MLVILLLLRRRSIVVLLLLLVVLLSVLVWRRILGRIGIVVVIGSLPLSRHGRDGTRDRVLEGIDER